MPRTVLRRTSTRIQTLQRNILRLRKALQLLPIHSQYPIHTHRGITPLYSDWTFIIRADIFVTNPTRESIIGRRENEVNTWQENFYEEETVLPYHSARPPQIKNIPRALFSPASQKITIICIASLLSHSLNSYP